MATQTTTDSVISIDVFNKAYDDAKIGVSSAKTAMGKIKAAEKRKTDTKKKEERHVVLSHCVDLLDTLIEEAKKGTELVSYMEKYKSNILSQM